MMYKVRAVQHSKHYELISSLQGQWHKLDYWIKSYGMWYDPVGGCFKALIESKNRCPRYSRTIHFRIEAIPGSKPIIWMW